MSYGSELLFEIADTYTSLRGSMDKVALWAEILDPITGEIKKPEELSHPGSVSFSSSIDHLLEAYKSASSLRTLCKLYRENFEVTEEVGASLTEMESDCNHSILLGEELVSGLVKSVLDSTE